ncbi:MAG: hypothetical protein R3B84_05600 [Zavarzinella sp.]
MILFLRHLISIFLFALFCKMAVPGNAADPTKKEVVETIAKATAYFTKHVEKHGGYVYFYSLDLSTRYGEGIAQPDQIWVQAPGTPYVGMAYLAAWEATRDPQYLKAVERVALALVYGQLKSGGWTNSISFSPASGRTAAYRNGMGTGRNYSTWDDGISQLAIRFLLKADVALEHKHPKINDSLNYALSAMLASQFPNGAFPQGWQGKVAEYPAKNATLPSERWRTEGKIKNYWDLYTLNDNLASQMFHTLNEVYQQTQDKKYLQAIQQLGNFLICAQLPAPQPAWAQQYNYEMVPVWARKFEPPAIAGSESQDVIETLLRISIVTQDKKYLEPFPKALKYLQSVELPDQLLARYYEFGTNKPLYFVRTGNLYELTYKDDQLPSHYGWKTRSKLKNLQQLYEQCSAGKNPFLSSKRVTAMDAQKLIKNLDSQGRWVDVANGEQLVGQTKMAKGTVYLSSETFADNINKLATYLKSID